MKKLLLSFSALVILGLPRLIAQVPNAGFEQWTPNLLVPTANDPNGGLGTTGWWDLNVFNSSILGGSPITVFKDNYQPFQGTYCAKIVSQTMSQTSFDTIKHFDPSFNYPQTNGLIFTATIGFTGKVTAGIPITNNWKSFSFYYKYFPNGSDTCSCTIGIYHWNSVTHQRDLIGGGIWKSGAQQASWTPETVNIFYDSASSKADTAFILFSAASIYSNPKVNDSMMIDSSAYLASGIDNIAAHSDNVNLYPNPANNQINFAVTGQFKVGMVEVYDITGKLMGTYIMHNNLLTINTQSFNTGLYLYKMYDNTGAQLNVGKFSVVK
ncbi:MAG TPA: T9SS type A sorting domain-containing protein [Bacteroidia bacterium]|jgi:hypothetical protein|nr:T9SS type A sorting domain-containing protein [Bacteroidia bacterium]